MSSSTPSFELPGSMTLGSRSTEEGASIAVAVLFGLSLVACLANFRLTKFRVYLLSGLSATMRLAGYACRAAYWSVGPPRGNTNDLAAALALTSAGFGISIAVQTLMMGCWFKNASEGSRPPRSWPHLSKGVRLLIAPIVVFGPLLGIATAALIFGVTTPSALSTASQTRQAGTWGIFGALLLLLGFECAAAFTAARGSAKSARQDPNQLVFLTLFCGLLLLIGSIFRVVSLYHPNFTTNPDLFFPLTVLPELLEIFILCLPTLLARMAMGAGYQEWQVEARLGGGANGSAARDHDSMASSLKDKSSRGLGDAEEQA